MMKDEIYRRPYKVRKAALRGKEITIPPEVPMEVGETVIAIYDSFILYVPKGSIVDENLLAEAIKIKK